MNPAQLLAHFDRVAEAPDAVPRLRRLILDLAVRGKLVEHDPEDEPGSVLLKRIASKKAQLVEAGEIRREKPLSLIEEEELSFDLPSSWSWARLRNLTSYMQRGKSPSYTSAEGSPVISQRCIQWDGLHLEWTKSITPESLDSYEPIRFLRDGDLLWNSTGTGTIGRVTRVEKPAERLVCDSHVTVVRCLLVDERFICIWLRSDYVYGTIEDRAAGATNQVELTAALASNQLSPTPPLAEQHRIVAKVDELMALCDELEAAQAKREKRRGRLVAATLHELNNGDRSPEAGSRFTFHHLPRLTTSPEHIHQLRQTIRNLAVRGRLVTQLETDIQHYSGRSVPESGNSDRLDMRLPPRWSWVHADDVAQSRLGKMLDRNKNSGNPYQYLRNTNVHWFEIRLSELKHLRLEESEVAEYSLINGDVLICEGGHGIGRAAVWRHEGTQIVFQKALHRVRPGADLDGDFFALCVYVYFQSGVLQNYFTGVGIPHLTGRALAQLVFPLPPLAEQHRIVAKVDELMALCDALEAQLATTATTSRQLLEAVLHEALA